MIVSEGASQSADDDTCPWQHWEVPELPQWRPHFIHGSHNFILTCGRWHSVGAFPCLSPPVTSAVNVCVATGDILREARSSLVINYSDGFECVRLRPYLSKSIDFGRLCTEPTDKLWQSLNMIMILTQLVMHFVFKSSLTFKNDVFSRLVSQP